MTAARSGAGIQLPVQGHSRMWAALGEEFGDRWLLRAGGRSLTALGDGALVIVDRAGGWGQAMSELARLLREVETLRRTGTLPGGNEVGAG